MIKASAKVTVKDYGMEDVVKNIVKSSGYVDIGIHSDESSELLVIAAANEYGAEIDHPGGTPYGFKTEEDSAKGRVSFLKKGEGYSVLGFTKPHKIFIPARSYIRSTVDENKTKYDKFATKLLNRIADDSLSGGAALDLMGQKIEGDIKRKMTTLRTPPNAPSTIRKKKGKANPLIDRGILRSSIRYVVNSEKESK